MYNHIFIFANSVLFFPNVVSGRTITVDDDGGADFTTIQDAIDNATDGDTIRVFRGGYDGPIIVNKSVSLIGNGSGNTRVYGLQKGDGVKIIAIEEMIHFHLEPSFPSSHEFKFRGVIDRLDKEGEDTFVINDYKTNKMLLRIFLNFQ